MNVLIAAVAAAELEPDEVNLVIEDEANMGIGRVRVRGNEICKVQICLY